MFPGFSQEALSFLNDIRFNNNKEWFEKHKKIYTGKVYEPMKALGEEIYAPFRESGMEYKVGRIYRDTTFPPFLHYRDTMWIYVRYPAIYWNMTPTLYFELSPEGAEYGFRISKPSASVMERFRAQAAEDPESFLKLTDRLKQQGITIGGEEYKRPKKCTVPELADYYKKKGLSAFVRCDDAGILFTEKLTDSIVSTFRAVMPLNDMFNEIVQIDALAKAVEKEIAEAPDEGMIKAPDVEFMW